MSDSKPAVRLYYLPQSFPCGPQSSCCGPVGQSDEELRNCMMELESGIPGLKVETVDVSRKLSLDRDLPAVKLIRTFGPSACPIFVFDNQVVSMGPPSMPTLIAALQARIGSDGASAKQPASGAAGQTG